MSSTDGKREDALKSTNKDDGGKLTPYRHELIKRLMDRWIRRSPLE